MTQMSRSTPHPHPKSQKICCSIFKPICFDTQISLLHFLKFLRIKDKDRTFTFSGWSDSRSSDGFTLWSKNLQSWASSRGRSLRPQSLSGGLKGPSSATHSRKSDSWAKPGSFFISRFINCLEIIHKLRNTILAKNWPPPPPPSVTPKRPFYPTIWP